MQSSFLTSVFLPLALFIIMLGMGLGLTLNDFKRVLLEPRAVILGLIAQLIVLPCGGFLLAMIFPLSPELAVGVMILTACPGGPTSNMMTYLVKGNVALSITLTAMSSLITVFTIPLVVNPAMLYFMEEAVALQLPFLKTVIQIAVVTFVPVTIGMLLHNYTPSVAAKLEKSVKWLSLFFLGLIIAGLLLKERDNVLGFFFQVGGVTLTLNLLTMALGYAIAIVGKLSPSSAKAITVEVGIQNGTLAIAVATNLLDSPDMAIPAAIYSLIMFLSCGAFIAMVKNRVAPQA